MVVASVMLLVFLLAGWKISRRAGFALMGSYVVMVVLNAIAVVGVR